MFYIAIFIALLIMAYAYDYRGYNRGRNFCLLIIFIAMVLLAGLRFRLGQDTVIYIKQYESISPIYDIKAIDFRNSRYAPGYIFLTSIFKTFTSEFTVFQLFHAFIVNGVIFLFLKKQAKHLFFALFLFYVFMYLLLLFQQMRESLAVCIFLLAWPAFREGKWLWWYLAALVAMTFHVSASMMFVLPAICLPGVRQLFVFGKRTYIICIVVLVVGTVIQTVFFRYVQLIAVTESMMERAQVYSRSELSGTMLNINGMIGRFFQMVLYPLIAMACLYVKNKQKSGFFNKENIEKIEMMTIMSLYVSILSLSIPIIGRYNNYFFLFSILIVSDWAFTTVPFLGRTLRLHYIYWLLLFTPMIGFQVQKYFAPVNNSGTLRAYMVYYPYSSYFDQSKNEDREKTIRYIVR